MTNEELYNKLLEISAKLYIVIDENNLRDTPLYNAWSDINLYAYKLREETSK